MKQSVQVEIQGQEFSLRTDLPAAEVQEVADFVNDQIGRIAGPDHSADTYRAVVLALLNVAGLYLGQKKGDAVSPEAPVTGSVERLEHLVTRIEDALRDPQGMLDF